MGVWRRIKSMLLRKRDGDGDGSGRHAGSQDDVLDAKVASLGPAPPGYLPKPDDGRPRH